MHTPYTTLISVEQLQQLLRDQRPVRTFDTSFELMNPAAGEAQYTSGHIPGALYAHLDLHLSAKGDASAVSGGRHPLPSRERFAQWLGQMGVGEDTQVVVYDRQGVNYCGRLWWMLKWVGHEAVAVLDGGWQAWLEAGGASAAGLEATPTAQNFVLRPPRATLADTAAVVARLGQVEQTVLDARAPARYRGETEPLDPVAGHIPGALNRPFASNFDACGKFKTAAQLRAEFAQVLGGRDPGTVVHHCGSGVSAVPNVLAMRIAGLGDTALYAGSWSEWCSDAACPVARG